MMLDGKLYPAEQIVITTDRYKELRRKVTKLRMEQEESLDKSTRSKLEAYLEQRASLDCYTAEEYLKYGFALGIRLMQEVAEVPYLNDKE